MQGNVRLRKKIIKIHWSMNSVSSEQSRETQRDSDSHRGRRRTERCSWRDDGAEEEDKKRQAAAETLT